MSIKPTDTQLVLLGEAAQRKDLCLAAAPTLKGATAQKVASKLISAGFVKEVKAKASDPIWRWDEGASYALKLTAAGAKAIAVDDAAEPEDDAGGEESDTLANRDQATILSKLDAKDARPADAMEPGPIRPSAPRGGSKLAQVIELLHRDHGATIEELIAATGWLAHTTRAALTGLRKRGYVVAIIDQTIIGDRSTASREVRPASMKGRRTPRRRAGRSRAGRSRKPIERPDGWAPTAARHWRRPASPAGSTRGRPGPDDMIAALVELDANGLCLQWRNHLGGTPPAHLSRWLLDVSSRILMGHSYRVIRRMRYGTGSSWERHNDKAVRRAIQHSQASLRALAKRYGINQKTVAKWKGRTSVADAPTGPKEPDRRSCPSRKRRWSSLSESIPCCRSTTASTPCSRPSRI